MQDPKIKTVVEHSCGHYIRVVGTSLGKKYLIATVDYVPVSGDNFSIDEAENHAEFISTCFNNSDKIIKLLKELKS